MAKGAALRRLSRRGSWVQIPPPALQFKANFEVISANLEENGTLYTSVDYSTIKINETIARTYPDSARDTNHLNITTETEIDQNTSMNYYWDKSTGILVEMSQRVIYQTGGYLTSWSTSLRILTQMYG